MNVIMYTNIVAPNIAGANNLVYTASNPDVNIIPLYMKYRYGNIVNRISSHQ